MPETLTKPELLHLRPAELEPWPGLNPRKHFSEERIREIAASIADHGVLQNLVVTDVDGRYWIVAGETRWRGAQLAEAGCPEIELEPTEVELPCRVLPLVEGEALALAMLENLQRQSLTAVEEARGFQRLIELNRWTQAKLAEEMLGDHRRQSYVAHRLRLLELPEAVLDLIEAGHLQHSHARDYLLPLLKLEDDQPRIALERVVSRVAAEMELGGKIEGPWLQATVREVEAAVLKEYGNPDLFADSPAAAVEAPAPPKEPAPEAAPAPLPQAKAPAQAPPPAPAPEKETPAAKAPASPAPSAPPAAPVATLPLPDAARTEIPDGAGIVAALLAATGGRPTTLSVTPLPSGQVAVTVAPRPGKAGETPFARTGSAAELDEVLIAAVDAHFTR